MSRSCLNSTRTRYPITIFIRMQTPEVLTKACDSAKTTSDTQATRTWYYRNTVRSYSSTAASGTCTKAVRKPHACPNRTSNSGPRNCCAITNETRGSAPNSKRTAGKSSWCGNASSVRRCATNGWNGFTAKSWTIP